MVGKCNVASGLLTSVAEFLSSSTIHGLAHISSTRRLVRLLWVGVVVLGFTLAAAIIKVTRV